MFFTTMSFYPLRHTNNTNMGYPYFVNTDTSHSLSYNNNVYYNHKQSTKMNTPNMIDSLLSLPEVTNTDKTHSLYINSWKFMFYLPLQFWHKLLNTSYFTIMGICPLIHRQYYHGISIFMNTYTTYSFTSNNGVRPNFEQHNQNEKIQHDWLSLITNRSVKYS